MNKLIANPEPIINLVILLAIGIITTSLLLLLLMLRVRLHQATQEDHKKQLLCIWEPVLAAASIDCSAVQLPALAKKDYPDVLILWNRFQESMRGESKENLIILGRKLGIEALAERMLSSKDESERTIAALTLGNMGARESWPVLEKMALTEVGLSGQVAARALARIDPKAASPILIPLFVRRHEWPQSRVAAILSDMGAEVITTPMISALLRASPEELARFLRYLPFAYQNEALEALRLLLSEHNEAEVLTACLVAMRNLAEDSDIAVIKNLLHHPEWVVRVQAVNTMVRLARREDLPEIIALLSDPNWWVRYRSAQALAELQFISWEQSEEIKNKQEDRYAKDALTQVMAEKQIREKNR